MKAKCIFEFDIEKLPKKGVYVVNHVSYLDPILLFAFWPFISSPLDTLFNAKS